MDFINIITNGPEYALNDIYQSICWIFAYSICVFVPVIWSRARYGKTMKYILIRTSGRSLWLRIELWMALVCLICSVPVFTAGIIAKESFDFVLTQLFVYWLNVLTTATITKAVELLMGVKSAYIITLIGTIFSTILWSMGTDMIKISPWCYGMMGMYHNNYGLLLRNSIIELVILLICGIMSGKIINYHMETVNGNGEC